MINIQKNLSENISLMPNTTLNELLVKFGISSRLTITNTFVLPSINIIGIIFCSISARIFFKEQFRDQIFFYYRVLSIVYICGLLINMPSEILFSPLYFADFDAYSIAIFQIYYITISNFLFHYASVLEICMLLTRIKIFSPFVRKNFSASPKALSIIFFIVCFTIDYPLKFSAKPEIIGEYYFIDKNGLKKSSVLYCIRDSKMSPTKLLLFVFAYITSNIFTLITSITLNIVSLKQYKAHLRRRKNEKISLVTKTSNKTNLINYITLREKHTRNMENNINNISYMTITLCSISILFRFINTFCFVYFYFFHTVGMSSSILTTKYIIYTFVPTSSIFVFIVFNKLFRSELKKIFFL